MQQPFYKTSQPAKLERDEFHERFARSFSHPRFDRLRDAVAALEEVAWRDYCERQRQRQRPS